jgi:hypothetical protein
MPFAEHFFISAMVALIFGGMFWFIYDEITTKHFCVCDHEYNDHMVVPRGFVNPAGTEKCKKCGCRQYKARDKKQ